MGLQSQLTDVSSESLPILVVATIASCVNYLRSSILGLFHSIGLSRFDSDQHRVNDGLLDALGSGLAGLILLADQLNINRVFSYRFVGDSDGDKAGCGGGCSDCVVCLCRFRDGEQVRRLPCGHVFHTDCFHGWLDQLNFTCPICRSPLVVADERVDITRRRVGEDVVAWFSIR